MPKQNAAWFGSCWHIVMAEHYIPGRKRGRDMHEVWDEQMKFAYTTIAVGDYFSEDQEREWVDARALGHEMIDGYQQKYKGDPHWEVLMPEQRFRANIPFNRRQVQNPANWWNDLQIGRLNSIGTLVGTFDMPIRDHSDNKIKVVDHKTSIAYDPVLSYLTKDDQGGTYIAVGTQTLRSLGLIKEDEAVTGMIFNFARKAKADDRPTNEHGAALNKDGTISKRQPLPRFWRESVERNKENRMRQISRIADDIEQIQAVRHGVLGISKNPGKHCQWCDYKDLCDVDENGGDSAQYKKDVFKFQDPYADHRENAINSKLSVENAKAQH
jgi:Zierdtviridae exonuclease